MANKTIPELPEIELEDLADSQLFVLETATETHKLRLDTFFAFIRANVRTVIEVEIDGTTTGDITVDVTEFNIDATVMIWMLKKPASADFEQMAGPQIKTPDADTVVIPQGDFAITPAGTYLLVGI